MWTKTTPGNACNIVEAMGLKWARTSWGENVVNGQGVEIAYRDKTGFYISKNIK